MGIWNISPLAKTEEDYNLSEPLWSTEALFADHSRNILNVLFGERTMGLAAHILKDGGVGSFVV